MWPLGGVVAPHTCLGDSLTNLRWTLTNFTYYETFKMIKVWNLSTFEQNRILNPKKGKTKVKKKRGFTVSDFVDMVINTAAASHSVCRVETVENVGHVPSLENHRLRLNPSISIHLCLPSNRLKRHGLSPSVLHNSPIASGWGSRTKQGRGWQQRL